MTAREAPVVAGLLPSIELPEAHWRGFSGRAYRYRDGNECWWSFFLDAGRCGLLSELCAV